MICEKWAALHWKWVHVPDICWRKARVIWHILALTGSEMLICRSRWLCGSLYRAKHRLGQGLENLRQLICLWLPVCLSLLYVWGSHSGVTERKVMAMSVALETSLLVFHFLSRSDRCFDIEGLILINTEQSLSASCSAHMWNPRVHEDTGGPLAWLMGFRTSSSFFLYLYADTIYM